MLSVVTLLLLQGRFLTLRLGSASSFPKPLSAKEEQECLRKIAEGDEAARNHLIEHNLRLVAHIAKKYYNQTGESDDLISIGTIGLIKAVNTYRPDKNIRLATYAARCIENAISTLLRQMRRGGLSNGLQSTFFSCRNLWMGFHASHRCMSTPSASSLRRSS